MATTQSEILSFESSDSSGFQPSDEIEAITGVRDLRDALEWYRSSHSRSSEGLPLPISGVWDVICGQADNSNISTDRIATVEEMEAQILTHREEFVSNNDQYTPEQIDRVIALLRGLDEVDSEYRVYGEDRERTCSIDVRARCYVGLYHVTEKTTIMTYLHQTPGMGAIAYSIRGVESPRMDVEDKLRSDVFYSKYEYDRLDTGETHE